VLLWPEELLQ